MMRGWHFPHGIVVVVFSEDLSVSYKHLASLSFVRFGFVWRQKEDSYHMTHMTSSNPVRRTCTRIPSIPVFRETYPTGNPVQVD